MSSRFTGKLEIWFRDGQINDVINTQKFGGSSLIPEIVLYAPKSIDNPESKP